MNLTPANVAQQEFDRQYISASEIQRRLGVARCTLTHAHQRGTLPLPILVGAGAYVWERAIAEPFISSWETKLKLKRGRAA